MAEIEIELAEMRRAIGAARFALAHWRERLDLWEWAWWHLDEFPVWLLPVVFAAAPVFAAMLRRRIAYGERLIAEAERRTRAV
jgi:hypothetical protein